MVRHTVKPKTKGPSATALYDCVSFDLMYSDTPAHHVAAQMQLPFPKWKSGSPHVPTVLVINIMLPLTSPSMFADKSAKGPMVMIVLGMWG